MIKINSAECNTKIKMEDMIGFALNNGCGFLDQAGTYLAMFWNDDVTYDIYELAEYDMDDDTTLTELLTKINICEPYDIIKVFEKNEDFKINITW